MSNTRFTFDPVTKTSCIKNVGTYFITSWTYWIFKCKFYGSNSYTQSGRIAFNKNNYFGTNGYAIRFYPSPGIKVPQSSGSGNIATVKLDLFQYFQLDSGYPISSFDTCTFTLNDYISPYPNICGGSNIC